MTKIKVIRSYDITRCHNSEKRKNTPKLVKRAGGKKSRDKKARGKKARGKKPRSKPAPEKTSYDWQELCSSHSLGNPINNEVHLPVSRKGKEEYRRSGNLRKALAIDRKIKKRERACMKGKNTNQKNGAAFKKSNFHPDVIMSEDRDEDRDEDDVAPYYPLDWDEEPWYIEALWGNGQADKWNSTNYVRYGLPCPHVNIKPPIIYHHGSYVDVRYIIPENNYEVNVYRAFI